MPDCLSVIAGNVLRCRLTRSSLRSARFGCL